MAAIRLDMQFEVFILDIYVLKCPQLRSMTLLAIKLFRVIYGTLLNNFVFTFITFTMFVVYIPASIINFRKFKCPERVLGSSVDLVMPVDPSRRSAAVPQTQQIASNQTGTKIDLVHMHPYE